MIASSLEKSIALGLSGLRQLLPGEMISLLEQCCPIKSENSTSSIETENTENPLRLT